MDQYKYLLTPFIAWFIAGCSKFLINSIRAKKPAFGLIGYGGFPSNHSAIIASATTILILDLGINHPAVAIAVAFSFIVVLDANSLRRQIGLHARKINELSEEGDQKLRERMGHTRIEILGGLVVGTLSAFAIDTCMKWAY